MYLSMSVSIFFCLHKKNLKVQTKWNWSIRGCKVKYLAKK